MKNAYKFTALLAAAVLCSTPLTVLPVSAETAASTRNTAQEQQHTYTHVYFRNGNTNGLYRDEETGEWFSAAGELFHPSQPKRMTASCKGVYYTVDLDKMQVYAEDGTVNETLTALLPDYLAYRPLRVEKINGISINDLIQTEGEETVRSIEQDIVQSIPLQYSWIAWSDDPAYANRDFYCEVSVGGVVLGTIEYQEDYWGAPCTVPRNRAGTGLIVETGCSETEWIENAHTQCSTGNTGSGTTFTTTKAEAEKITDLEQIRAMLTAFIAENELDARVTDNIEYPCYQPIVIEYNGNAEQNAWTAISEYIREQNIDKLHIGIVPVVDGVVMTTTLPNLGEIGTVTTYTTTNVNLTVTEPADQIPDLWCWGIAAGSEFQNMKVLDDKGMFSGIPTGECIGSADNYQVLTYHYAFDQEEPVTDADTGETKTELHHYEGDPVYVVCPRENYLRIVLRSDLDEAEARQKAAAILRKYYPELLVDAYSTGFPATLFSTSPYIYDLCDKSETAGSEEISAVVMKELAKAGLISEFYSWGQTANYQEVWHGNLTLYYPTGRGLKPVQYDWDAIEVWVKEHHPECRFVCVTKDTPETAKEVGAYDYVQDRVFFGENIDRMYAVIPSEGTDFPTHFAIAAKLYEQFGIAAEWGCPETAGSPIIGNNALAVAGDLNLDCEISVADAVMLARINAEDKSLQITDTGIGNADMDGDGLITVQDTVALLKSLT